MKMKVRKKRKCGICANVTDNTQKHQIGENSVLLCTDCSKDIPAALNTITPRRSKLSSLIGFTRAPVLYTPVTSSFIRIEFENLKGDPQMKYVKKKSQTK